MVRCSVPSLSAPHRQPGTAKPDAGRALSDVPRWRGRHNQSREAGQAIKPCDVGAGGGIVTSVLRAKSPVPAALDAASSIAESAAQSTITMQARKGRASYLGERSIGHGDPGATSVMFMMQMLALAQRVRCDGKHGHSFTIAADWEKVSVN